MSQFICSGKFTHPWQDCSRIIEGSHRSKVAQYCICYFLFKTLDGIIKRGFMIIYTLINLGKSYFNQRNLVEYQI